MVSRQRGSHIVFTQQDQAGKRTTVVPLHKAPKKGLNFKIRFPNERCRPTDPDDIVYKLAINIR